MVGFMLIAITGFTTLLVIESLTSLSAQLEEDDVKRGVLEYEAKSRFELLGVAILVQSWISGLFLGKIPQARILVLLFLHHLLLTVHSNLSKDSITSNVVNPVIAIT